MKNPRYYCKTSTKGTLYYDELPKDAYFAMGFNGTIAGEVFWFGWDNGTCLIPICHCKSNKQVINKNPKHEGMNVGEVIATEMILN